MATQKCKTCGEDIKDSAYKAFGLCSQCGRKPALPKMSVAQESAVLNDIDIEIPQEPTATVESDNSPAIVAVPAPAVETAKEKSAEQIKREKEIAAIVKKWDLDLETPPEQRKQRKKMEEEKKQIEQNEKDVAAIIEKWRQVAPDRVALFDEDGALVKIEAEKNQMKDAIEESEIAIRKHKKLETVYFIAIVLSLLGSIVCFVKIDELEEYQILTGVLGGLLALFWLLFCSLQKIEESKQKALQEDAKRYKYQYEEEIPILEQLTTDIKLVNDLKNAIAQA